MLFLTYWKLNEELSSRQSQEIAQKLTGEGLFPPEDVELLRWDSTPDGWGIALMEADDYATIDETLNMWRIAAGDAAFFEETRTAPASPVQESLPRQAELLQKLE